VTRPAEAAALLRALWAFLDDEALVELRPLYVDRPDRHTPEARLQGRARRWMGLEQTCRAMPEVLAWCARNGLGAYFGALPRVGWGKGTRWDVLPGGAAWADLDVPPAEAAARLERTPFPPSAVVLTGAGVHAYWLLSEPVGPEVCEDLSRRLTAVLDADRKSTDRARILRLPGSVNTKYPHRPVARLARLDPGVRFHAEDLADWLPPAPKPKRDLGALLPKVRPGELRRNALRVRRFAAAGLDHRIAAILSTPPYDERPLDPDDPTGKRRLGPGRRDRLFGGGWFVARAVARGALHLDAARDALISAGVETGLDLAEVTRHVCRGIDAACDEGAAVREARVDGPGPREPLPLLLPDEIEEAERRAAALVGEAA
jgi:hypothetical protein